MMITIGIIVRDQESREQLMSHLGNARPDAMLSEMPDLLVSFARESFDPHSLHPDECLPDITLIDMEGQDATSVRRIKAHYPQSQIIVVSDSIDTAIVLKAYRDGAANYVQKSTNQRFLHYAILSTITAATTGNSNRYLKHIKYSQNQKKNIKPF